MLCRSICFSGRFLCALSWRQPRQGWGLSLIHISLLPHGDEVLIDPRLLHQRLMGAPLGDLPIGYDEDLIRASDGVQPVGDDQQGFALHQL